MVKATSESLCVSSDMVAAAGLGLLSVCCNNHQVCLKEGWFQPLALFMVGCANAGERKSPVLSALKAPIDTWVKNKNSRLKPQIAESRQKLINLKNQLKRAEKDAEKGKEGAEELTIELAKAIDEFQEVKSIRMYSGDVTPEKIAGLLKDNSERFSIISSEGGILTVISGDRYGNGTANYDIFCQGFNCETVNIDRVNAGTISLESPVLSMILFIQPVVLSGLLGNDVLQGVGLIDRCLLFAPMSSIGKERFDADPIPQNIETAYCNMIFRLLEDSNGKPLRLSEDARKIFANWYDQFTKDIPFLYDDMTGWASKFRGVVGRIAGILQLAEDGNTTITSETMSNALRISEYFEEQARLILRQGGLNQAEKDAAYLLGRIKALKKKTRKNEAGLDMLEYRKLRQSINRKNFRQKSDFIAPLQVLIDKGYIDLNSDHFETATEIIINPKVWG